ASDGNFYGSTDSGILHAAFKLTPDGTLTKIADLGSDGYIWLQGKDGYLYGGSNQPSSCGELFRMSTNGVVTHWISLQCDLEGKWPGRLIPGSDGNIYG